MELLLSLTGISCKLLNTSVLGPTKGVLNVALSPRALCEYLKMHLWRGDSEAVVWSFTEERLRLGYSDLW